MAAHTKVNLRDVEDQAPKFGMSPGIEARYARIPLELEQSGVNYFRLAPDFRTPFGHRHSEQEEVYVVLSGGGRVQVGEETVEVGPYDAVRVAAGAMHSLEAGPEGLEYIAIGAPNTDNKDAEMVQGWWGEPT
jgi:mannose-6-phosphate isomerase-like protein (cupin superfamily)